MRTRLVTVTPDDSMLAGWELLSRGRFHHLPVIAPDGRCVGVVDDRLLAAEWLVAPLGGARRTMADLVPARVHCALADTPLQRIAQIMAEEQVSSVPIVDHHMRLIGLITERDLVAEVANGTS